MGWNRLSKGKTLHGGIQASTITATTISAVTSVTAPISSTRVTASAVSAGAEPAPVVKVTSFAITSTTGAGGMFAWQNPESSTVFVTGVYLDVTVPSTSGTVDVGVTSTSTTTADNLIDGGDSSATSMLDSMSDPGTNGAAGRAVTSNQYVSGTFVGTAGQIGSLAGTIYIAYA